MKKPPSKRAAVEMQAEYDFSGGVRGKYAARYRRGTNVVLIDPELSKAFPDSKSVNDALRTILRTQNELYGAIGFRQNRGTRANSLNRQRVINNKSEMPMVRRPIRGDGGTPRVRSSRRELRPQQRRSNIRDVMRHDAVKGATPMKDLNQYGRSIRRTNILRKGPVVHAQGIQPRLFFCGKSGLSGTHCKPDVIICVQPIVTAMRETGSRASLICQVGFGEGKVCLKRRDLEDLL